MSEWQPIETAPKNKIVLVYEPNTKENTKTPCWPAKVAGAIYPEPCSKPGWVMAYQHMLNDTGKYGLRVCYPTHWMPLPEPPTSV